MAAVAILTAVAGLAIGKLPLSASQPVKYRTSAVDKGSVVSAISATGTVKPLAAILVGSQASGQIQELRTYASFAHQVRKRAFPTQTAIKPSVMNFSTSSQRPTTAYRRQDPL